MRVTKVLLRQLSAGGLAHPALIPVDSLTAQKRLVEAGLGVALLPESSVREELRKGSLRSVQVASLRVEQPIVAVQRRSGHRHPLARAFLELLARSTRELRSRRTS